MRHLVGALVLMPLLCPASHAQDRERLCIDDQDAARGLDLVVDDRGTAHITRVKAVGGDVLYTRIPSGGEPDTELVFDRASRLGIDEVRHTDLLMLEGQPIVCFYNAHPMVQQLVVGFREEDGWRFEQLGADQGRACALAMEDEDLVIAWRQEGRVMFGRRRGEDNWQVREIDASEGRDLGEGITARQVDGTLYVAYLDHNPGQEGPFDSLRVAYKRRGEAWATRSAPVQNGAGVRPRITPDGEGGVFITHGHVPTIDPLDQGSDAGLIIVHGRLPGELLSDILDPEAVGGTHGAWLSGSGHLVLVARERLRHPIFGQNDALRMFDRLPAISEYQVLEGSDGAGQRHLYLRLRVEGHPFDRPLIAFSDERAPFHDDPGGGLACLWRPVDSDADWVPDADEGDLGTDPENPDTDGDGRDDGQEALFDNSDPTVADEVGSLIPPDMGVPEPDMAVPEPDMAAPEPDMAVPEPDMEVPDPDMEVPDPDMAVAEPDMAVAEPDMAVAEPDMALPDPDMALPDPDMAAPDPDMAEPEPDMAEPEPDMAEPEPDVAEPEPDVALDAMPDAEADAPVEADAIPEADATPDAEPPLEDMEPLRHIDDLFDLGPDAGETEASDSGCGCRAGEGEPVSSLLLLLLPLALRRRRR